MNYYRTKATRLARYKETYDRVLAILQTSDEFIIDEMADEIMLIQVCQNRRWMHTTLYPKLEGVDNLSVQCSVCDRECYLMLIYISEDGIKLVPGYTNAQ